MKGEPTPEEYQYLFNHLETIREGDPDGRGYWKANELQHALSFGEQNTFFQLLKQAKKAAVDEDVSVANHFIEDKDGIEATRLTRYACHLIVRNADSSVQQVAFAQNYFVSKSRELSTILQRMRDAERVLTRDELAQHESSFSGVLIDHGVTSKTAIATTRSLGDRALFGGRRREQIQDRLKIKRYQTVSDFLPIPILEAKSSALKTTREEIIDHNVQGQIKIENLYIKNSEKARTRLIYQEGIKPEYVSAEEDIKKVRRRHDREEKDLQKES